jgi:hypothetical protein
MKLVERFGAIADEVDPIQHEPALGILLVLLADERLQKGHRRLIFLGTRQFVDEADMVRDLEFLVPDRLEKTFTPTTFLWRCPTRPYPQPRPMWLSDIRPSERLSLFRRISAANAAQCASIEAKMPKCRRKNGPGGIRH